MITIKYKGEIVDLKDIEINWVEYVRNEFVEKTGDIEDYAQSRYSEGYDDGYSNGYDEGSWVSKLQRLFVKYIKN